jgi:hypothetical protein
MNSDWDPRNDGMEVLERLVTQSHQWLLFDRCTTALFSRSTGLWSLTHTLASFVSPSLTADRDMSAAEGNVGENTVPGCC